MLSRLFTLLIVVAVQACPLLCRGAFDGGNESKVAACPCCAEKSCGHSEGEQERDSDLPAAPSSGCICCGAVLERQNVLEAPMSQTAFDAVATAATDIFMNSPWGFGSPAGQEHRAAGPLLFRLCMSMRC